MTLRTIQELIDAYVAEHRYDLWGRKLEVGYGIVGDNIIIRANSFPDVASSGPMSAAESYSLPMFHSNPIVRDPARGLAVYVTMVIERLIGKILEGRNVVQADDPKPPAEVPDEGGPGLRPGGRK